MKRTLLIKRISIILILLLAIWKIGIGQPLFIEHFDLSTGDLPVSPLSAWTSVNSGTAVQVKAGSLSYVGYVPSSGNSVGVNVGLDYYSPFTSITSGSVYAAFLLNVTSATTGGDYVFHFMQAPTSTYYKARVWIKQGTSASKFYIGVAKTGTAPAVAYSSTEYDDGTTYLVVVKYQFNTVSGTDDVVTLYVNPTISVTEPASPTVTASDNATADATTLAEVAIRQPSASTAPNVTIDEIRAATTWVDVISDIYAPVGTFSPLNNTIDVPINVTPTITFDESVFKTDGSAVTDADLSSLLTFKQTNASGSDVPFSATISANKKIITLTPTSGLNNSQIYYLGIGALKDASGNQTSATSITFTTIAAATPTVNLTNPVGGETLIANDPFTFTWTSANITNVNIEAWVIDFTTKAYIWIPVGSNVPAAAGKYDFTIPADASYGTEYKIRISDASNASINSVSGNFTLYSNATSISDLKTRMAINDIFRLSGEAVVTYVRPPSTKQTYFQDDGAGIMIYDGSALISPALAVGDKFTKLIGKLSVYQGMFEILPQNSKVTLVSTGNSVTPKTISVNTFNTNFSSYESMLVNFSSVSFNDGNGTYTFGATTNYNAFDGTNTLTFRTFPAGENNVIGSLIPTGNRSVTGLGLLFSSAPVVSARSLDDINFVLAAELTSANKPVIYPIPAREVLRIRNIENVSHADILDASGRIIRSTNVSGDDELTIPVSDLKKGMYFLRLTTPSGKVTTKFIK